MPEPMTADQFTAIVRRATDNHDGENARDTLNMAAEVRRLQESLDEEHRWSRGWAGAARRFEDEVQLLRARIAQLEGRDELDLFRPGGA